MPPMGRDGVQGDKETIVRMQRETFAGRKWTDL